MLERIKATYQRLQTQPVSRSPQADFEDYLRREYGFSEPKGLSPEDFQRRYMFAM